MFVISLTVLEQCFQHTGPVHKDLQLYVPSGTHQQGTVQDAAAHQILPCLELVKGLPNSL